MIHCQAKSNQRHPMVPLQQQAKRNLPLFRADYTFRSGFGGKASLIPGSADGRVLNQGNDGLVTIMRAARLSHKTRLMWEGEEGGAQI